MKNLVTILAAVLISMGVFAQEGGGAVGGNGKANGFKGAVINKDNSSHVRSAKVDGGDGVGIKKKKNGFGALINDGGTGAGNGKAVGSSSTQAK